MVNRASLEQNPVVKKLLGRYLLSGGTMFFFYLNIEKGLVDVPCKGMRRNFILMILGTMGDNLIRYTINIYILYIYVAVFCKE